MEIPVNTEVKIRDTNRAKTIWSPDFKLLFDKTDGTTLMCGRRVEDDPIMCPAGPIIADIEVTTICTGIDGKPCKFCYKSNTANGYNMPFKTFKKIIDTLPPTLTQVALGADAKCESNPEIWDMMEYCRTKGVVPNITVANVDRETAIKLSKVCGAVAVSYYGNWDIFFNTVTNLYIASKMEGATLKQVNIHQLVSEETKNNICYLINNFNEYLSDKINALVLLSLKQRGRGKHFTKLNSFDFDVIMKELDDKKIPYGFDSCSAVKVADSLIRLKGKAPLHLIESCESTLFSCYFDTSGHFYPCSFNEEKEYAIHINDVNDFLKDLWYHEKTQKFRSKLLMTKNKLGLCSCPSYEV